MATAPALILVSANVGEQRSWNVHRTQAKSNAESYLFPSIHSKFIENKGGVECEVEIYRSGDCCQVVSHLIPILNQLNRENILPATIA